MLPLVRVICDILGVLCGYFVCLLRPHAGSGKKRLGPFADTRLPSTKPGYSFHCSVHVHYYTTLHPFNGLFSRTAWVIRHQKSKPFWILLEQQMMGWQWHQLDHMRIFAPRSRQITTPVPHHSVFTGRMPFLPPNQQRQSTEGVIVICYM